MAIETQNTQLSVLDQLKLKYDELNAKIKLQGLSKTVFDTIASDAQKIQDKLNELFAKKGVLTQSDINDAYAILQEQQRKELADNVAANKKKFIIFGVVIVVAIVGFIVYKKIKK